MNTVTVTGTNNIFSDIVEYNVNNLDELINKLNKIGKLFCLMYGDNKVFHSLENIIYDYELKDNYTIVYLVYDKDLIFRIKEMGNSSDTIASPVINDISRLFKQEILYNDPIFLVFLAKNIQHSFISQCFSLIDDKLKNNSDFMMKLIKIQHSYTKYASEDLKNDKEFVLNYVKVNGLALEYASEDLRNDKEIVLVAVKEYGGALEYASEKLKNDREIVLVAVKEDGSALKYASEELRNDIEIILVAVKDDECALSFVSYHLRYDKEFILEAVNQCGWS